MKKFLLLLPLMIYSTLNAQDTQDEKRNRIVFVKVSQGMSSIPYSNASVADFNKLAPGSEILQEDMTGFLPGLMYYGNTYTFTTNSNTSLALGIELNRGDNLFTNLYPVLRIGGGIFSGISLRSGLYHSEQKPFDTLTSSQTGDMIFIDSITTSHYGFNYYSSQARLDGSLIIRTNPSSRFSFFSGIGVTSGISFAANTQIRKETYWTTIINDPDRTTSFYSYNRGNNSHEVERFNNKSNFGASVYLPIGFDFSLSKKNNSLGRLMLTYEARPSYNITQVPELRTFRRVALNQHELGLKYQLRTI